VFGEEKRGRRGKRKVLSIVIVEGGRGRLAKEIIPDA